MSAKIMLVGGGTGGHIKPNLAVAHALKQRQPDAKIIYVLEKKARFSQFLKGEHDLDAIQEISAGKFRRYHGESWLIRLFDIRTNWLNVRDAGRMLAGYFQAVRLLKKERPDAIFIKGSFVGVPVGLAAARLHIPFVTHDSDAMPGLANRLISRWATLHATGMPAEFYSYPKAKTRFVGIPLAAEYKPISSEAAVAFKTVLDIPADAEMLLIVGGSNGAEPVNNAVAAIVDELLAQRPELVIIHQTGPGQNTYGQRQVPERLRVLDLIPSELMLQYSGAADLIITRAGATAIAEFAAQAKACIVVPNPRLTGGHQTKNADGLAEQGAVVIYPESDLQDTAQLRTVIEGLLNNPAERRQLAARLEKLARPQAAEDIAGLLIGIAGDRGSV